jgi:hypothetical protein
MIIIHTPTKKDKFTIVPSHTKWSFKLIGDFNCYAYGDFWELKEYAKTNHLKLYFYSKTVN